MESVRPPFETLGQSADGTSHVERLNRDVDEITAALERGDPSHVRAAAELMRRWEQKGWRLEPSEHPGEPPRAVKIDC